MDFKSITKCSQVNNVLQCQCKTQKSVNASGLFFSYSTIISQALCISPGLSPQQPTVWHRSALYP